MRSSDGHVKVRLPTMHFGDVYVFVVKGNVHIIMSHFRGGESEGRDLKRIVGF